MDALLLREPVFVLERAQEIESERQRSISHAKSVSVDHVSDLEDASDDAHEDEDGYIQRCVEEAQALDARWPSSYVHRKLLVLQDIMEDMYRPDHIKCKSFGTRAQGHGEVDEARTPLMMSDLPLAMQLGLRMFFRITRSFQDSSKLVTNYRLIVQVASKLPSMLATLPPLHLSPGFLDVPQSKAAINSSEDSATEEPHVYSVFQQLFKILSDLLELPWNGSASATDAHSGTIVLTDSERSAVLTAFIALSLKWGRLRHLLVGIRAVLESPDCFGHSELALLTPLLQNVALATVELRPVSYPDEDARNGFLVSFGKGDHGKLGHGQCSHAACPDGNCTENKSVPTLVNATLGQQFVRIDSLSTHSVAILANGDVMAWGNGDKYRLGHGTTAKEYTPRVIESLSGKGRVTDIACGLGHTIALTQTGDIYAWGNGSNGRLGLGDTTDRSNPTQVVQYHGNARNHEPLQFRRIYCGASHSLAISTGGRVFSWGKNNQGQCGHGHTNDQLSVEEIAFFQDEVEVNVVHAAGGWEHTLFCTSSGHVYSCGCGYKDSRRAGIPPVLGHGDFDRRLKPTLINHLIDNNEEIVKVACGWDHSLAISSQGTIFSWGSGSNGKLGHGDEENVDVPTVIRSMVGKCVKDVKAGCEHSVMLTDDYEVWTCGQGDSGRLGHGDNQTQKSPKRIEFFSQNAMTPVSIAVGDKYNLVLVEEGCQVSGASESKGAFKRSEKSRHELRSPEEVHPRRSNSLRHELMKGMTDRVASIGTNNGVEWIFTVMKAFQNPANQENEVPGNSKLDVSFPENKIEFVLFLLGHIDRIATNYIIEGAPDHARQISYDLDHRGTKVPSMICPFSIDTSHGAIAALLDLMHCAYDIGADKSGLEKKALSSRDENGLLNMCMILSCLRILKVNLIKHLELLSLNRSNCADSISGEFSTVNNVDKTLSTVHALLLKLASSSPDELISMVPKQHDYKLPLELDLPTIAKEINKEAAQTLRTGFSRFYPDVLDRQRLLSCIIANASISSIVSLETVALSGCLCEDDVMEQVLLPLFVRKNDRSNNISQKTCTHQEQMDANAEFESDGLTASSLLSHVKSLLQRSVLQAMEQLDGAEKPHMVDCYLQLLIVIQMNCFSIINQFLMAGNLSSATKTECEDIRKRVFMCSSCTIDWILFYIETLLSESLGLLKRLHKASCQHEEIVVELLNNTFLHLLLPNAIESICILFQSLEVAREDAIEVIADEWECIQIRLVDLLGPYLLPIVKILDEINWKMVHLKESGLNQAEHERSDLPSFSELNDRNWAVDLEDACGVLCGKIGYVLMSLSKRIRSYPVHDEKYQIFFAAFFAPGRFLSKEVLPDVARNGDFSQDSKMFQWEEMGVFEVENEVECNNTQMNNGTDTDNAEILAKHALAMKFVASVEQYQSAFVNWFINHLIMHMHVHESDIPNVEAFKKVVGSILAVVAWYLDFTDDIRSYESAFYEDSGILVTELSNISTVDARANFWSTAVVVCLVLSQEQITDIKAGTIVENAEILLKLVPVSLFFLKMKNAASDCDDLIMHKMVFNLYEFLVKPINFSLVQKLVSRRSRNLTLYRFGLCLFHDLLRKLTIPSTRSCLVAALLRVTEKESYSISAKPIALHSGFVYEFTYGSRETYSLELTIENLFIRLAKQLSSHEASFDLKRKSLLAWLYLLRGKDFNSSWISRLAAKSNLVQFLSGIIAEDADGIVNPTLHAATHANNSCEKLYPNHNLACGTANGYYLPAKLKSVESLIFGQSSAKTFMIMARQTLYAIAMHLGRSEEFQQITVSPLFSNDSTANLSRDPSQKDVLTSRAAAVSPRKRSTLPKKAIISTVDECISQLYEFFFVGLQKIQQQLQDQGDNARRLVNLIGSAQSSTEDIVSRATIFTIGNPIHISSTVKQTFRSRNESHALFDDSAFTLSFWICLEYPDNGQEFIAPRSSQIPMKENEAAIWNCMLALDNSSTISSDRPPNSTDDMYSLVLLTCPQKTNQLAVIRLMIRNFTDKSDASLKPLACWTIFDIETHLPFGQWTHCALVIAEHNASPIFYLNGKKSSTKKLNDGTFAFVFDPINCFKLILGGPATDVMEFAFDKHPRTQDEPSQSIARSQSVVVDDVWVVRGAMKETDFKFLAKQGPTLLQMKNHHIVEKDLVDLLCVLYCLTKWDNTLQILKPASSTSSRWICLLYQALEECPPDSFAHVYLLELLRKTLPHASDVKTIQVQSVGKIVFQSFSSLISSASEKTAARPEICSLFARVNELIPGERGRCFPALPKHNEMLYSLMQAHGYLCYNTHHSTNSNNSLTEDVKTTWLSESSPKIVNPECKMQTNSTRLFCGVKLVQDMWSMPVWKNEINEMFERTCAAVNKLKTTSKMYPFDSNTSLALVVTIFITACYSENMSSANKLITKLLTQIPCKLKSSPDSSEILKTKYIQSLLIQLFSCRESNALNLRLLGRQELSEHGDLDGPEYVHDVDIRYLMLLRLKGCLLRLLTVHLQERNRDGLIETFSGDHPAFFNQLFQLASSSAANLIKSCLGPDCKIAMKRRGFRAYMRALIQRDKNKSGKMISILDLEHIQVRLWQTATSSEGRVHRAMWRDTKDLSIKSPLDVVSGDVELRDMQVKGISHFPTVKVTNAAIAAHTGLWFYEVVLLTDGLFQIGFIDRDFVADSIQGQGVGDHSSSWAFDGFRCKKWHVNSFDYGESWNASDVVGVLLDTDRMEISFFLNGRFLGVAFTGLPLEPTSSLCPAISLNADRMAQINIGSPTTVCENLSSAEQMLAFQYLPVLDFGNEQFSIQPVALAVLNASVKPNADDSGSVKLDDESYATSETFDDDDEDNDLATNSYELRHFRAEAGIENLSDSVTREISDSRDGSYRELWSDDIEKTARQTNLMNGLVNVGFPREWAVRCATETDSSINDSGAISWILEQMEKGATAVATTAQAPSISSQSNVEQRSADSNSSSFLDMMMLQFGDRATRSADNSALRSSSHTLPHQITYSYDQHACNLRNLRPHTESQHRSRTVHSLSNTPNACSVTLDMNEKVNTNPFLCAEQLSHGSSKMPQEVYLFSKASSRPLFVRLLNFTNEDEFIHDKSMTKYVINPAILAPNEVIPLWLAVDVSLSVQYAREIMFSFLTSNGETGGYGNSYEIILKWISNTEPAIRFKRLLKILLGLENNEMIMNPMLNADKRSSKEQSISIQQLLLELLSVELKRSVDGSDGIETFRNSLPLFELLFDEIRQQLLFAFANATSPQSHQSSKPSVSLTVSHVLWTHWVLGVLLTHVETLTQLREQDKMGKAMKAIFSSCFSLSFFQLLTSLASGTMRDFLPWKYAAFTVMRRMLYLMQIYKPESVAPVKESTFGDVSMNFLELPEPLSKFVNAAQVEHLMEFFVSRIQKEKSTCIFFTDVTRVLVGLLVNVSPKTSSGSEHYKDESQPNPQLHIEEFSATHASAYWSYRLTDEETAKLIVLTREEAANERGESFRIHRAPIFALEARRQFGYGSNDEWLPDKNVNIVCNTASDNNNSLSTKGSFEIRDLAPDTRYLLRLVPIPATILGADEETSLTKVTEVFIQTQAFPPFEFDSSAIGKHLIVFNQNLTVKNLHNKKWRTVRTQASFSQGIHIWSVRIDTCVSKNIFIGVCTCDANLENYIGSDAFGYGFLANKAVWHNKTKLHSYGEIFKQGDIIQVTLDCDAKTLAFNRNGENLGIAASNLKFNGKSAASCKWYPAVSMYNKDDQISLIPPSLWPSTATSSKESRSQNACALPILGAVQDLIVHNDIVAQKYQCPDKSQQLYEKVFAIYQKWERRAIICREIVLGSNVAMDIRPSATEKYGFAHGDSIFTEKGQCFVLGEYHHELWYEIVEEGKRECSSWNLIACREMLENPNEFPVHRIQTQAVVSTVETSLKIHDDGVQVIIGSDAPIEQCMDSTRFAHNQKLWTTLSSDTFALDRKVIELLDATAAARSLSDPHYLSFTDIKAEILDASVLAFIFEGLECTQDDHLSTTLARIGYLFFINRSIFQAVRFIMPEMNTFGSIEPCVTPTEDSHTKMTCANAEDKSRAAIAALATTELATIIESTGWILPDPSDLSQLCQQSIGYLFQAQKDTLIDAELLKSATPTMGLSGVCTAITNDSSPPEAGIDKLDLPRFRMREPHSKPVAFWNQPRVQLPGSRKKWVLTKQSHRSLFAQLSDHLQQMSDTRQLRRAYETPFDMFSIYRAFDVVIENQTATSADGSDGSEEPQEESEKRTQNMQYLRLLEAVTTEIQSPLFPLLVPTTTRTRKGHGTLNFNSSAYKEVELGVNTRLFSSRTTEHSVAQALQWYFQFGQILGIAWRSRVRLPLQFVSYSLWDYIVKPTNHMSEGALGGSRSDGNPDSLCRRSALHSVRKGLLSIVPSRCLQLSTASSLRARLCDSDLSLLCDLQSHAIYDRESELHHSFWVILEELTYLERRAMHQYLTGAKASRSETLESWIACRNVDLLEASSSWRLPNATQRFQLEICAPTEDMQEQADDSYPVVVVLNDHSSRLHLPAYSSAKIMYQKLTLAAANPPFVL